MIDSNYSYSNNSEDKIPNPRFKVVVSRIPIIKKTGLKQPTVIHPSKKSNLKQRKNTEFALKADSKNIISFTPAKLDSKFREVEREAKSGIEGNSTYAFSDSKSYQSSQF